MRATYLALCEHGYAGLTIQRIGEQFEKSKSLLYHHYDDKDELLLSFLQFMLEEHESSVPETVDDGADARLDALLDVLLPPTLDDEEQGFTAAMVELRAQAANDERYREQYAEHDRAFHDHLVSVIEDGIEEGVFKDVEPDPVTEFLGTVINGAMTRRVTGGGDESVTATRAEVDRYLDRVLRAETGGGE